MTEKRTLNYWERNEFQWRIRMNPGHETQPQASLTELCYEIYFLFSEAQYLPSMKI
jgi:hypothetical protein